MQQMNVAAADPHLVNTDPPAPERLYTLHESKDETSSGEPKGGLTQAEGSLAIRRFGFGGFGFVWLWLSCATGFRYFEVLGSKV